MLLNGIKKIISKAVNDPMSNVLFCSPVVAAVSLSILGCYSCPDPEEPVYFKIQMDAPNKQYEQTIELALQFHREKYPEQPDWVHLDSVYQKAEFGPHGGEPHFVFPSDYIGPTTMNILLEAGAHSYSCYSQCERQARVQGLAPEKYPQCVSVNLQSIGCVTDPPDIECEGGRRPPGLMSGGFDSTGHSVIGSWWARLCHLEDAAVYAFVQLANELQLLDAPEEMIAKALDAAEDEREHVKLTKAMAMRYGVVPQEAQCAQTTPRDLWSFALDNAVEGCIRESFAALQTLWQSKKSTDFVSSWVLNKISEDETRHGELSWQIHAWCCAQLNAEQQSHLERLQKETLLDLCERKPSTHHEVFNVIGLPTGDEFATLARCFSDEVEHFGRLSV